MDQDRYRDLRVPDDSGRPTREEVARLIYAFDAVADERRTRADYLHVADNVLEVLTRRGLIKPDATGRAATRHRSAPAQERPRDRDQTRTSQAATPYSPCNRTGPFGAVITWPGKDWTGRSSGL
ncbi:hypothetical protein ABZ656_11575 [Streptomyces sp. NPDC007095]|jgi:hypothetical protein|uniref:hypothetical protein n=1 Tax=Streptomyces sp. NPDC007095 TaxID=3154482 RepID=UPI0015D5E711